MEKYANKFEVRWANWEIINLEYRQEVSEYFLILQNNIQDKLLSHTWQVLQWRIQTVPCFCYVLYRKRFRCSHEWDSPRFYNYSLFCFIFFLSWLGPA